MRPTGWASSSSRRERQPQLQAHSQKVDHIPVLNHAPVDHTEEVRFLPGSMTSSRATAKERPLQGAAGMALERNTLVLDDVQLDVETKIGHCGS